MKQHGSFSMCHITSMKAVIPSVMLYPHIITEPNNMIMLPVALLVQRRSAGDRMVVHDPLCTSATWALHDAILFQKRCNMRNLHV